MKKHLMVIGISILILLFACWIGLTEYNSNNKNVEEGAYRNFIEQLKKDKEVTDQFYKEELPMDTFHLSKFSLQNNFELCTVAFHSINKENSDRYLEILTLFNEYWDLSTEETPSELTLKEVENLYNQLLEIHEDMKREIE
jgi:hypothetical protein